MTNFLKSYFQVETASSSPSLSTPSSSSEELTPSQINYDKKRPEQEEFDPFEPQVEIIEGDGEIDFADNPYFQPPEAETDPPRVLVENPLHQEAQRPQKRRRKIMRPRRNFGPNQPRRQNGRPYVKQ